MLHNTAVADCSLDLTAYRICVIYLKRKDETPGELRVTTLELDGTQTVRIIPAIVLPDLTLAEIARRDLLVLGQFYLRIFDKLTLDNIKDFDETGQTLLELVHQAARDDRITYEAAMQMQDNIRRIAEDMAKKPNLKVQEMASTIVSRLPWFDYCGYFKKREEEASRRAAARGKAEGKAERGMEIALKAFERVGNGESVESVVAMLQDLGITDDVIAEARKSVEREGLFDEQTDSGADL